MESGTDTRGAEEYLQHQSAEMFNLLRHYESLSFMVFQFYLTGVVAIVTIMLTVTEKLGAEASLFTVPATRLMTGALLLVGMFVYSRQLWLQIRMTRALRQINAIRNYFADRYDEAASTVLYPTNPLKPSFLEPRDPLQLGVVVLMNGAATAFLLPIGYAVVLAVLALLTVVAQLALYAGILLRCELNAQRWLPAKRDFLFGAPLARSARHGVDTSDTTTSGDVGAP
jgi:hypothetical protein